MKLEITGSVSKFRLDRNGRSHFSVGFEKWLQVTAILHLSPRQWPWQIPYFHCIRETSMWGTDWICPSVHSTRQAGIGILNRPYGKVMSQTVAVQGVMCLYGKEHNHTAIQQAVSMTIWSLFPPLNHLPWVTGPFGGDRPSLEWTVPWPPLQCSPVSIDENTKSHRFPPIRFWCVYTHITKYMHRLREQQYRGYTTRCKPFISSKYNLYRDEPHLFLELFMDWWDQD